MYIKRNTSIDYTGYRKGYYKPGNEDAETSFINNPLTGFIVLLCKIRDQALVEHEEWEAETIRSGHNWNTATEKIKDHYVDPLIIYERSWAKQALDYVKAMLEEKKKERNVIKELNIKGTRCSLRERSALIQEEDNTRVFHACYWPYLNIRRASDIGRQSS